MSFSVEDEALAEVLQFDSLGHRLTLKPKYEAQMVQGKSCPLFEQADLKFTIESNLLGSSKFVFKLLQNVKTQDVQSFEFFYNWQKSQDSGNSTEVLQLQIDRAT